MNIKTRLKANLEHMPHAALTLLLLALAVLLTLLALVPGHWVLKVAAALWVLLP